MKISQLGFKPNTGPDRTMIAPGTCPDCLGEGQIDSGRVSHLGNVLLMACPACEGTGKAPEPVTAVAQAPAGQIIGFGSDTQAAKAQALDLARAIPTVGSAADNEAANVAVQSCHDLITQVEKARTAWLKPLLTEQRRINTIAKTFSEELEAERTRLNTMCGSWLALEEQRSKSAKLAADKEASELERKRHEALAQAQTHEEADAINLDADNRAADLAGAIPVPVKASGQQVKKDWTVEVVDRFLAYTNHPGCFSEPAEKISVIKALLDNGQKLKGIIGTPVTVAAVRASRTPRAIPV